MERAFDLVRSGGVQDLNELRRVLKSEGYDSVEGHLAGLTIRKQLKAMLAEAVVEQPQMHAPFDGSLA